MSKEMWVKDWKLYWESEKPRQMHEELLHRPPHKDTDLEAMYDEVPIFRDMIDMDFEKFHGDMEGERIDAVMEEMRYRKMDSGSDDPSQQV